MITFLKMISNCTNLLLLVMLFKFCGSFYIEIQSEENPGTLLLNSKSKDTVLQVPLKQVEMLEDDGNNRVRRQVDTGSLVFTDPGTLRTIIRDSGAAVVFKCETNGTPTPLITWYKNGDTPVKRTSFPVTYDKWSLLMTGLMSEDSGQYKCRVCYKLNCIERQYSLTVTGTPYIELPSIIYGYPGNKIVKMYNTVEITCPVTSETEHMTKWLKVQNDGIKFDGVTYNVVGPQEPVVFQKGKNAFSDDKLIIHKVTKTDEGWYTCITSNSLGNDTATGHLTVKDDSAKQKPQWLTHYYTLAIMLSISSIIAFMVFVNFRREKKAKQQALKMTREIMSEQWTKIISIERAINNGYVADGILQTPVVRIKKKRLSEVKENFTHPIHASEYVLPVDTDWEISKQHLTLGKVLGEGEFGRVVQAATSIALSKSDISCTVAVKMLKEGHSDADMVAFVSEMEIMKMIGKHENIINLLGCCTQNGPLYVVVEYARNGCLREFLNKHKPDKMSSSTELIKQLTQSELIDFSLQVAKGMEYLASRGCIHRDLAARNVLVSAELVLKVADFGLARDVRDSDYYRKQTAGKLPLKWMAPEAIGLNYYNKKSDVWSFGVLMWEIMTLGNAPYPHIPMHYLYDYLKLGKRMQRPNNCRQDIYKLMRHCWAYSPDDRPTFTEVKETLQEIYSKTSHFT